MLRPVAHSSFMIPGGVMCADAVGRHPSIAILDYWKREWLEGTARLLHRPLAREPTWPTC